MRTVCSREIFTEKCRQQQNFDSDPKEAWHYNHVTFTPIANGIANYMQLSMLYVRLTINVKVGIPESFKVGWNPYTITGSSHLNVECTSANSHIWHFLPKTLIRLHQESRPLATLVTIKTLMPVVSVSLGSPKYSLIDSRFIYIAVCIQENLI